MPTALSAATVVIAVRRRLDAGAGTAEVSSMNNSGSPCSEKSL
jgi:hypothetical protein